MTFKHGLVGDEWAWAEVAPWEWVGCPGSLLLPLPPCPTWGWSPSVSSGSGMDACASLGRGGSSFAGRLQGRAPSAGSEPEQRWDPWHPGGGLGCRGLHCPGRAALCPQQFPWAWSCKSQMAWHDAKTFHPVTTKGGGLFCFWCRPPHSMCQRRLCTVVSRAGPPLGGPRRPPGPCRGFDLQGQGRARLSHETL